MLRWATLKPQLQAELRAGTYRLGAVECIHLRDTVAPRTTCLVPAFEKGGRVGIADCPDHANARPPTREVWAALDALVLKATAIVLTRCLEPQLSPDCYHLPGHGGAKAAGRAVAEHLAENTFVFRTDVKSYYASIDHDLLFGL